MLCAIVVHKHLENMSVTTTVVLGDTFLHHHEHTVVYFDSISHTSSCCQKYSTKAPNVDSAAADNSSRNALLLVFKVKLQRPAEAFTKLYFE